MVRGETAEPVDRLDVKSLNAQALGGLSPSAITELAASLIAQLVVTQAALQAQDAQIKAWKFGARTEAMNVVLRRLFEETAAEDEADLEARLAALKAEAAQDAKPADDPRKPRRAKLPEHLRRVDHHLEPETTTCDCGEPMQRIREDASTRRARTWRPARVRLRARGSRCTKRIAPSSGRMREHRIDELLLHRWRPADAMPKVAP